MLVAMGYILFSIDKYNSLWQILAASVCHLVHYHTSGLENISHPIADFKD